MKAKLPRLIVSHNGLTPVPIQGPMECNRDFRERLRDDTMGMVDRLSKLNDKMEQFMGLDREKSV